MADPRTFVLIGEFKDGITPELAKINNELAKLKANFAGIGSRKNTGFRGVTNDIGKLVSAHKNLTSSIKEVDGALRSTLGTLQQYRREMGKAAAATRAFQKSGGKVGGDQFTKNMDAANRAAQAYLRTIRQINEESRRAPRGGMGGGFQPPRPPRGGMGGGFQPPRPPRGGMGEEMRPPAAPKSGGGVGMNAHMAEFGFAYTLGNAIAQPIQNAVVTGFQIGVGLMTKPFEYFANAFGERVQDQLSDLKAAGGLFSISKRSDTPFLKTIDEAIQYQQDTNRVFAKMAASLPGVTNDYVQVGKRLSDTMGRIASGDFQNALQEANRIRATEEGRKFYGKEITGTGPEATKEVITTLLGEMTKKTTIAGLGGRSGAGGISGAYGLPGLTERMLSQQEVSMGQFQRYAAVFSDPTIQDALSRNVDLINQTLPNTTARFKAMQKLLDEVVTPDLIEKLRTSVDGIYQGLRSAVLDPDTGLFGLGRQFEDFGYKINQYGQYIVDKEGKKIKDSLSIFEIIADIFSNAGQAILPLVEALPLVFDPLKKVASILMDARHYAAEFNRTFNMYREGLKELSETPGKDFLKDTLDVRASLSAVSNLLYQFGAIGKGEFESIGKQLLSKDLDIAAMLKSLLDSVLNSQIASEIGATIGEIIGVVISEVAGVTGFISGRIAKSNKLFDGIKAGFEKAGGPKALSNIFKDIFSSMLKALLSIGKLIPLEGYFIGGAALVLPAVAQGLGMKIGEEALKGVSKFGDLFKAGTNPALQKMKDAVRMFFDDLIATIRSMFSSKFAIQEVTVRDLGSNAPKALPPAGAPKALPPAGALANPAVARGMSAFTKFMTYVKGVGPRFLGFFKGIAGKLTIFGGILTSVVSLFQGKNLAESLADGAGPVLGAALGAALIPFFGPIGPLIGSLIGGWVGSMKMVTEPLTEIFSSLGGSLTGLKDSVGMILTVTGDLFGEIIQLVAGFAGVEGEVDGIKIALAPITLTLQALEVGLKGFALLLAEMRVFFKRFFGSPKEYQEAIAERDKLNASMRESQGRINAYNASMLGTANLQKQVNDAQYELINGGKKLNEARKKELVAFIESAKKLDKEVKIKKNVVVTATEKAEAEKPKAPAKKVKAEAPDFWQGVQSAISAKSKEFSQWFKDGITQTWQDIQTGQIFFNLAQSISQSYTKVKNAVSFVIAQVSSVWSQFTTWFVSLPGKLQAGYNFAVSGLNNLWNQFSNWFVSLPGKLRAFIASTIVGLQQAWSSFTAWFTSLPGKFRSAVSSAFANIGNVTAMLAAGIRDWLKNAVSQALAGWKAGQSPAPKPTPTPAQAMGSPGVMLGSLGEAVSYEQQHKPAGSDLVVANTSETVIPAAGGYGMKDFMSVLTSGFSIVNQQYKSLASGVNTLNQETNAKFQQSETANSDRYQKTSTSINNYHQQTKEEFGKINQNILQLSQKVATMSSMGGMLGGMGGAGGGMPLGGGYGGAGVQIAGQLGNFIKSTGGAPGSIHEHPMHGGVKGKHAPGSYHYSGRAIDIGAYANEQAGVIARIKQFNAQYGVKPVEFLHAGNDPNHQDHVHVAYALGAGVPAFFQEQKDAVSWEKKHLGAGIKSITTNSAELPSYASLPNYESTGYISPGGMQPSGMSGTMASSPINITAPITINQQPGQDADELASIVALKIGEAVADARAASIFV